MKHALKSIWRLKTKILALTLVLCLLVGLLPMNLLSNHQASAAEPTEFQVDGVTEVKGFDDVNPDDWFFDAVFYAERNGIFSGTGDNNFTPRGTMTRAMFVTALGRMIGVDTSEYSSTSFNDIQSGSWYEPYVAWAVQNDITDGTGQQSFSPNAIITREQMVTMTLRFFESYQIPYQTNEQLTTQPNDIANVSSWAADAVMALWQAGLFVGDSAGNFNPQAQAIRAEAAVIFMRSHIIVTAWKNQNQVSPTPNPSPTPNSNNGSSSGGSENTSSFTFKLRFETNGGTALAEQTIQNGSVAVEPEAPTREDYKFVGWYSDSSLETAYDFTTKVKSNLLLYAKWVEKSQYTLSFESNGGTDIDDMTVQEGKALNSLPAPVKEGVYFQGWFRDSEHTLIFADGNSISEDTTLYAKYIDSLARAVQRVLSHSILDVSPSFTITVEDASGSLDLAAVQAGMTIMDVSDPNFTSIQVTGTKDSFTVSSATDAPFIEGHTYQLTLTDDNLVYAGLDASTRVFVFSIAKQEIMTIPLNADMIYLLFADVEDMMLDGEEVGSPAIPVISTTVNGQHGRLSEANGGSGTFAYDGPIEIQVGDVVAIYEGVRPDLRTVDTTGDDNGDIAYIQITEKTGTSFTYSRADADQVLFKPDILPVSVTADTDGEADNHSITVEHTTMNYSDAMYAPLGLDELTTVDVGDFIGFYEGAFAEEDFVAAGYGRITSITSAAEMDIITYVDATLDDITNAFTMYQSQTIEGEVLLSDDQIAQLEGQIEQQALASGFVDQAAGYLSEIALETEEVQTLRVSSASFNRMASRVDVQNLTVVADLGTRVKHINGKTSGISATLQVAADIVVQINDEGYLVIHMTGTFIQEISLDLNVNSETKWHWYTISTFFGDIPIFPIIDDYIITANLDTYGYTGLNITAEIGLVEQDKLAVVLNSWIGAEAAGALSNVRNIATQIEAVMAGVQDTEVDAVALKEQYQEMLEQDTEWVKLIEQELFEYSVRVALGIIEIKFSADFVVSAQVNLSIGADFNYKMAKRYSVTLRVLSFSGTSNTVNLPGDGDYQFTFYVMGTLGLRAGIHLEVQAGIGSVDLNSIGVAVEPGVYINLWGYFYYQIKNVSGLETTKSLGLLYVEMGIYLEVELGAQIGDGALSDSLSLIDKTWPLYTIGQPNNVYDFSYEQDDTLGFTLAGAARGIALPKSLLEMNTFDLLTGDMATEVFPSEKFDIQVDNENFIYHSRTNRIEVVNRKDAVTTANLVITWKGTPLSFTAEPIKRTIPLVWLAREGQYTFQLDPQNGGMTQIITAEYDAPLSATTPIYPGYTFIGWYTEPVGGTEVTIPNRMPAEDRELYAQWTVNNNTPYTVEHYLVDPNPMSNPVLAKTEILTGTTDTNIRINSEDYKDQGYANATSTGLLIRGDGSTVVKLMYQPTNRSMTFNLNYSGATNLIVTDPFGKDITSRIPVPTRTGYTFEGWSPSVPSMMPKNNSSYTATWKAKDDTPYKVVHLKQNMDFTTFTVADTDTYRGTTDTVVTLTSSDAKTYAGFEVDNDATGTLLSDTIASNGKTVLKVYYKRAQPSLFVDYNGSGQQNKNVEVPFGATLQLYLGTPTRIGHEFTGWSPTPPTTMPDETVSVTAQWAVNQYEVNFETNGANDETESQTVDYGELATLPIEPTKDDYVFSGWYSDEAFTTEYDFTLAITGDMTLYAKWLHSYTVSFDSNEGSIVENQTVNEGAKVVVPSAPIRDGYVFSGWYSDSQLTNAYNFTTSVVTSDLTLYAKWTVEVKITYTVSFESSGGTTIESQTVTEGGIAVLPADPVNTGYTFAGWYSNTGLTTAYGFTEGVTSDITLYAKWIRNSYTVTFNSNAGSAVSSQTVVEDATASKPTTPTKSGYLFSGWYSDNTLTNVYDFNTAVTANITLYAKWDVAYTVSFNSNGGSGVANQNVVYDGYATSPNNPTRERYVFLGWYSDEALTEPFTFTTAITDHLQLHAKWADSQIAVTFDSNGGNFPGSGSSVTGYIDYNGTVSMLSPPNKQAYILSGWYTDRELTNEYDFSTPVTSAFTLYAKWEESPWKLLKEQSQVYSFNFADLAIDSAGIPHLMYNEKLSKYENGQWSDIPNSASSYGLDFKMDASDTSYVLLGNGGDLVIRKFNGSAWEDVGSTGFANVTGGSIAFDSFGTPYVAFHITDSVTSELTLKVIKYEDGSWVTLSGGESFSVGPYSQLTIKLDSNDTPYVLLKDSEEKAGGNLVLAKYENDEWTTVGRFTTPINGNDPVSGSNFAFNSSNVPYVIYSKNNFVAVSALSGDVWIDIDNGEFQSSAQFRAGIVFDSNDELYIAYKDATQGFLISVMKYDGEWKHVGEKGFSVESGGGFLGLYLSPSDELYMNVVDVRNTLRSYKYDPS